jgi:transposase
MQANPASEFGAIRRRRKHSNEFKARVVRACGQPGASISAVARTHDLDAKLVRRWVAQLGAAVPATTAAPTFIAMPLPTSPPSGDIRIDIQRDAISVKICWPTSSAEGCAAWLHHLLLRERSA